MCLASQLPITPQKYFDHKLFVTSAECDAWLVVATPASRSRPRNDTPRLNRLAIDLPLLTPAGVAPRLVAEPGNFVTSVRLHAATLRGLGRVSEVEQLRAAALDGIVCDGARALARQALSDPAPPCVSSARTSRLRRGTRPDAAGALRAVSECGHRASSGGGTRRGMACVERKQMQKLMSELARLYLAAGLITPDELTRHVSGQATTRFSLAGADGQTRAIVIAFDKQADGAPDTHWTRLCEVANALQSALGLPAPAVSISGDNGYGLWLSLAEPMPVQRVQAFLGLLHSAYFADFPLAPDAASAPVALPPCLFEGSGKWSAFIHPGMGASFADESGLEMAPPLAGQAAFLEGLHSVGEAQFARAMQLLRQSDGAMATLDAPMPPRPLAAGEQLLLRDATLEDIVRHLHAQNIEPTFRHVLPR